MITSLYLTAREYQDAKRLAAENDTHLNSVLRIGLRLLLGLEVPEWAQDLIPYREKERT